MNESSASDAAGRPRVVVSVEASADGRLTLRRDCLLLHEEPARVWKSLWPASSQALREASAPQSLYQPRAILEGSGSLVEGSAGPLADLAESDEPSEVLYADFLPAEVLDEPGDRKWFTVVDSRGRVRWHTKSEGGLDLLVLVARATPAAYLGYLRREHIPYLVAGDDRVDLAAALRRMRDRLGVRCVVSTAGGGLNGALLRAGLVDEISLLVCPAAIGGTTTPSVFDGPELADGEAPTRLRLLSTQVESGGVVWLRYEVLNAPQ
jgi:2,5-diamino-6-(ribosylamino)-4(3H)-pyrimidinone 5'-phosphate reductase